MDARQGQANGVTVRRKLQRERERGFGPAVVPGAQLGFAKQRLVPRRIGQLGDRPLERGQNRCYAAWPQQTEQAGERFWQLPLIDEYRDNLKSEIADLNNVGPRGGGAITAGLFLREFAGDTPWAHLDIAGPAFTEKDLPLAPKGATGVAVRTLLTYLTA